MSLRILIRTKIFSDKSCRENENTYFMFKPPPPKKKNHAVYEIRRRIWCRRTGHRWQHYGACALHVGWLTLLTHSECVIRITFPLIQWLQERTSVLCYTYRGADKSLARPGRKQAQKPVRDERDFNKIETRVVIKFFFFLQGKAPKEIHAILTETLACFLPGQAKDLTAPLNIACLVF